MGHAGTLDPAASGLMIIGVGEGTKKLNEYLKLDKEYLAGILIGQKTTTGDREGEVIEEKKITETIPEEEISAVLRSMIGTSTLPVSAYSAIKKDGVPFYKTARAAARQGEVISQELLPRRDMKVYEAELIRQVYDSDQCRLVVIVRFKVGSGTYIRSLAEELGRRLGYPASLCSLRRTRIGDFKIEDAATLAL